MAADRGFVMRGKAGFFAGVLPSVALLLHFDGNDQDDTTTDSSPFGRTVTLLGDAVISTAEDTFGGSSLLLDGTVASKASVDAQFNILQRDFTVDAWVYLDDTAAGDLAMVCEIGDQGDNGVGLHLELSGGNWFPAFYFGPNTSPEASWQGMIGTEAITPNQWTHVAWSCEALTLRMFVDGVDSSSAALWHDTTLSASSNTVTIGGNENGDAIHAFAGHIDELRIVVGKAEYTANFTPPTAAYT